MTAPFAPIPATTAPFPQFAGYTRPHQIPLEPPVQRRPMPQVPRLQAPPVPVPAAPIAYLDVAQMSRHSAA